MWWVGPTVTPRAISVKETQRGMLYFHLVFSLAARRRSRPVRRARPPTFYTTQQEF